MEQVPDEILLDSQVALVHVHHPRESVHVRNQFPIAVVDDRVALAIGESADLGQGAVFGDFLARVIEFLTAHPVDGHRRLEGLGGQDGCVGADKSDLRLRAGGFDRLGHPAVVAQRGGRGVDDDVMVRAGLLKAFRDADPVRRTVQQPGLRHQRGRLRQPGGVPVAGDLASGLVARAGSSVEAVKAGRREEEGSAHAAVRLKAFTHCPSAARGGRGPKLYMKFFQ